MARSSKRLPAPSVSDQVLEPPEASMLDLLDTLLNKGVMLNGDVTLGVAGIDLIYLRLSAILCAADRILPAGGSPAPRRTRHRRRPTPPGLRR
jgi:hypothetical protein